MSPQRAIVLAAFVIASIANLAAQDSKEAKWVLSDLSQIQKFAIVREKSGGKWAPLVEGAHLYSNSEKYQWKEVPEELAGTHYLSLPIHEGAIEFEVSSDGYVFLITSTRWGGGGNSSGDWMKEVKVDRDLRREGWRELKGLSDLMTSDPGEMAIYWRDCKQGETFRIRTEKYVAPMLLIRPVL